VEDGVIETCDIFATRAGRLVRADGYPPHAGRFTRAGLDVAALLAAEPVRGPQRPVASVPFAQVVAGSVPVRVGEG
jgi:hypothetical protein